MRNRSTRQRAGPWPVRRYLSLIVAVAITAFVATAGYGYVWSAHRADDRARGDLDFLAGQASAAIVTDLDRARETVRGLAAQSGLATALDTPAGNCRLARPGSLLFPSLRLDLVRADGRVVCSSGDQPSRRGHAGSRWLAAALASTTSSTTRSTGTTLRWNEIDASTGRRAVIVTAALPGTGPGPAAGLVAVVLHTDVAGQALAQRLGGPHGAGFTVVDGALGTVVTASLRTGAAGPGREFFEQDVGRWRALDGSRQLFASQPVPGSSWRVYAGLRSADVLAAVRDAAVRQAAVGLLALALLLAAVAVLHRRVAGPLDAVTEAVVPALALMKAGRDPGLLRVPPGGAGELVALAAEVNAMLDVRAGVEAELLHQGGHDRLTGLPNRDRVLERLEDLLTLPGSSGAVGPCAVLALGVNRFNLVNDSLGHEAADRVLVEVAQRLSGLLPDDALLSRHDGAEFVLVCPGTDAAAAAELAGRLDAAVRRPFGGAAAGIALSVATGIAVQEGRERPEDLLGAAHTAMHQAKLAGAGSVLFDPAFQASATARLQTEHDLRLAIERGEFVLNYQPLLDVASGGIVGAEALVRWQHPERGLLAPADFLPVAEQTGQIVALGEFVLQEACRQTAEWHRAGHPLRISVNVAADQFRRAGFVAGVATALGMSGLAADQLCLEITESALMRTTDERAWDLERLRHLGVHLAIDDFGTGYSSLSYLHELPVDELKIDRSFISRLDRQGRDAHLVEAIIRMAKALTLNVVAEGVETDDQLGRLAGLGCPTVQGFLIARPQPAEAFIDLVAAEQQTPTLAGR